MTVKKKKPKALKPKKSKAPKAKIVANWDVSSLISTLFSIGKIPYAPGTFGSLAGVVLFPLFLRLPIYVSHHIKNVPTIIFFSVAVLVLLYAIGVEAVKSYQSKTKTQDASEIIYDELFGQILTYSIIAFSYTFYIVRFGLPPMIEKVTFTQSMLCQFVPFLFFRFFDILKPWPINLADNVKTAQGVMLDDAIAAVYAAITSMFVLLLLAKTYL